MATKTARLNTRLIAAMSSWVILITLVGITSAQKRDQANLPVWREAFQVSDSSFSSVGNNLFFILQPGYQLTLEGVERKAKVVLTITVLNETKKIGTVETRIVEERETLGGELKEVSRNFFAISHPSKDVFYFGEEVDVYRNGKIVNHEGSWKAGERDFKFGLIMPGTARLHDRYYQEIAPGIAMDRAEIVGIDEAIVTPAGEFKKCLKIEETTPLEPKAKEYKFYASGIGLIQDGNLSLTKYGFLGKEK